MPNSQLTIEERKLQNIRDRFLRLDRDNTEISDNQRGAELNYGLFDTDTNLGYYKEYGATGKDEINEFNRLKFEEQYRADLLEKYEDYQESFNAFTDSYKTYYRLQSLKVELDNAKIAQQALIDEAKENGEDLSQYEVKTDVEGLSEAKANFNKYFKEVYEKSKVIHNLENEETFNKMLEDYMNSLNVGENVEEVEEALEEVIEEIKEEEPQKEDLQNSEEVKNNPEEEVKKEEPITKDVLDNINNLEYYATRPDIEMAQVNTINNYFKRFVGVENLESDKKYPCYGFKNDVTLSDAFYTFKQETLNDLNKSIEYSQNQIKDRNTDLSTRGINRGLDAVNERVDDSLSIREREDKFYDVLNYYSSEIRFDQMDKDKADKVSEIASIANRLSQIHYTAQKPGFFSRLFNTKYNKLYKSEEASIGFYKDILTSGCKLDPSYVDKITSEATCNEGINQDEFLDKFYEAGKSYAPFDIINRTETQNEAIADNICKIEMVKAAVNGRNPVEAVGDYFKDKENRKNKENIDLLNKEELDNSRIKIEVPECAPDKQGLDSTQNEVDNTLVMNNNGPEMDSL